MKKRRGFTLLEALITLWMMGVMLLLVSGLVKDMRQESISNKDSDQNMGAHQALDRMSLALRNCQQMDEPASGSSARVRLQSWNPTENNGRLPLPPAAPGPPWSPDDATFLLNRKFEVVGGVLLCTDTDGTQSDSIRLLGDLSNFQATRQSDGNCRLILQWVDSRGRPRQLARLCAVGAP